MDICVDVIGAVIVAIAGGGVGFRVVAVVVVVVVVVVEVVKVVTSVFFVK